MGVFEPRPGPEAVRRLVCFPHAGAGAATFRAWRERIPGVEVIGVRAPGRESRLAETAHGDVAGLACEVAHAITSQIGPDYALLGHSFGALVAFETARELRRLGWPAPSLLVAAAAPAPRSRRPQPAPGRDELAGMVRTRLASLGSGEPPAELIELALTPLEADTRAASAYSYAVEAPLDCAVLGIAGSEDVEVTPGQVAEWAWETARGFRMLTLATGHFVLETAREAVLRLLVEALDDKQLSIAPDSY